MAKMEYRHHDGTPVPNDGKCIKPDLFLTTFTITVRSLSVLTGEDLKQLVQQRYEVVHQPQVKRAVAYVAK